jgi:ribosome maturation factor RimP
LVVSLLIVDKVKAYLQLMLPALGLELFDIQFRREGHGWVLRVFIDSPDGVTLDHCADVSRELGQYLDVEDLIDHAYHLEVSSPGIERPLRSIEEFRRFQGSLAKVRLHEAVEEQKVFFGTIERIEGDIVFLKTENGKEIAISFADISKARLSL